MFSVFSFVVQNFVSSRAMIEARGRGLIFVAITAAITASKSARSHL